MKFIVRGKSVDFRNREGSSPSIPKKGRFASLTISPTLSFFSGSKFVMFPLHPPFLQTYPSKICFFSYHNHKWCGIYDIRTNERS